MCSSFSENIRIVQKVGSETKMWDVGCDQMVFAIHSDLFVITVMLEPLNDALNYFAVIPTVLPCRALAYRAQGLNRGINRELMDLWSFDHNPKTIY